MNINNKGNFKEQFDTNNANNERKRLADFERTQWSIDHCEAFNSNVDHESGIFENLKGNSPDS